MDLRIKEVAKQKGITIEQLAKIVDVSRRTIYNWANGNITVKDLSVVAYVLQCSVYELIEPTAHGFSFDYDEDGNIKGLSK